MNFKDILRAIKQFFNNGARDDFSYSLFPSKKDVTLDTIVPRAKLFNGDATVNRGDAAVFGSDVDGIIEPSESPYAWADSLWNMMRGNEWGPEEVDMSEDIDGLRALNKDLQWSYERVLHALIANDSEQTRNIAMSIIPYVSDGMVASCLSRQDYEEALHSYSYEKMVQDVALDTNRLYNLHKTDEFVNMRATYLERMYAELAYNSTNQTTMRTIMRALIANNILEGIMFYAGFIFLWALGDELPGSASMVSFIARDERTHIQLFRKMFNSTIDNHPMIDTVELESMAREMVIDAAELEKKWLMYVANGRISGMSKDAIEKYINGKADSIMKGLRFDPIYNDGVSHLVDVEKKFDDPNSLKSNFFERRPKTYSSVIPTTDGYITKKGEINVYNPQTK